MALFQNYRRGSGRRARSFATYLLLAIVAWLSYALLVYGNTRLDRLLQLDDPFFGRQLVTGGGMLTDWITPSVFLAVIIFGICTVLIRMWLNRPRFADLLIETEAELKRVKWATRKEVVRATGVVLYFVVWFSLILFVMDLSFVSVVGMLQGQEWYQAGWGRIIAMVFRLDVGDAGDAA
jgi:preprotein translocase SecE subunit